MKPTLPAIALTLMSTVTSLGESDARKTARPAEKASVVFVCAHGNVKSLIATEWLNRVAAERGIAAHAVARGLAPENPVPPAITERLRRDGIDVTGYESRALAPPDLEGVS